jgi:hypothetical protein
MDAITNILNLILQFLLGIVTLIVNFFIAGLNLFLSFFQALVGLVSEKRKSAPRVADSIKRQALSPCISRPCSIF